VSLTASSLNKQVHRKCLFQNGLQVSELECVRMPMHACSAVLCRTHVEMEVFLMRSVNRLCKMRCGHADSWDVCLKMFTFDRLHFNWNCMRFWTRVHNPAIGCSVVSPHLHFLVHLHLTDHHDGWLWVQGEALLIARLFALASLVPET